MTYCNDCGAKLIKKDCKKDGLIDYCPHCDVYKFPNFNCAVSMLVLNQAKDKLLLIQQYSKPFNILVAGYVNIKENAEEAAKREVFEEVGLNVVSLTYNTSYYFEVSNTLIFNFEAIVDSEDFTIDPEEVDVASWFTIDDASEKIKENSLAQKFLLLYLNK